jgi:hypothetical protein
MAAVTGGAAAPGTGRQTPQKRGATGYNQNGSVRVLGYSRLTDPEMKDLTEAEKQEIRD